MQTLFYGLILLFFTSLVMWGIKKTPMTFGLFLFFLYLVLVLFWFIGMYALESYLHTFMIRFAPQPLRFFLEEKGLVLILWTVPLFPCLALAWWVDIRFAWSMTLISLSLLGLMSLGQGVWTWQERCRFLKKAHVVEGVIVEGQERPTVEGGLYFPQIKISRGPDDWNTFPLRRYGTRAYESALVGTTQKLLCSANCDSLSLLDTFWKKWGDVILFFSLGILGLSVAGGLWKFSGIIFFVYSP